MFHSIRLISFHYYSLIVLSTDVYSCSFFAIFPSIHYIRLFNTRSSHLCYIFPNTLITFCFLMYSFHNLISNCRYWLFSALIFFSSRCIFINPSNCLFISIRFLMSGVNNHRVTGAVRYQNYSLLKFLPHLLWCLFP